MAARGRVGPSGQRVLPQCAVRCGALAFYLAVWFGLAALATVRLRRNEPLTAIAAPGLILLGLTVNFAAIDSIMSLDPHFNSSAFGMINAAESGLFALSVTILVASSRDQSRRRNARTRRAAANPADPVGVSRLHATADRLAVRPAQGGRLVSCPFHRNVGRAGSIDRAAHFLLPFLALMIPRVRRSRPRLIATTTLLVIMAVIRGWWLVLPAHARGIGWIDVAAVLAFGGITTGLLLRGPFRSGG